MEIASSSRPWVQNTKPSQDFRICIPMTFLILTVRWMLLAMKSLAQKKMFLLLSQLSPLFLKELSHFSSYI